jgi:hypothetical protein
MVESLPSMQKAMTRKEGREGKGRGKGGKKDLIAYSLVSQLFN